MMNGGYIVKAKLLDNLNNILTKLIENGYLEKSRIEPLIIKFKMKAGHDGKYPQSATKEQIAIVISLRSNGDIPQNNLEFIAIDPASWYLNIGKASGKAYTGKVSQVIRKVVEEYAPKLDLEISETIDNENNKFWMYRQDPKTFIKSLIDWSSSVTQNKTQFIMGSDGNKLVIKEQAEFQSKPRAFYNFWTSETDSLLKWDMSATNTPAMFEKAVTQGMSTVSGQYFDKITDQNEEKVFVKDSTTINKLNAKTNMKQSFTSPDDSAGTDQVGWSVVKAVPEIYSAGDIGLQYDDYLDGRARNIWLNAMPKNLKLKISVWGHGEWSESIGLGSDTVFLKFAREPSESDDSKRYIYDGNWIVYGFHHRMKRGSWFTDLYIYRNDFDAKAQKVGGAPS